MGCNGSWVLRLLYNSEQVFPVDIFPLDSVPDTSVLAWRVEVALSSLKVLLVGKRDLRNQLYEYDIDIAG